MRRLVSRLTVGAVLVFAMSSVALSQVSAADDAGAGDAGAGDVGTVCAGEQYAWSGEVALGAGESFNTGVHVDAQDGTQLSVSTAGAATDEGSSSLAVHIGDAVAAAGDATAGGDVSVTNVGPDAVHVTAVDVVVNRCHQVASQAPSVAVTVESVDSGASADAALPVTGAASRGVASAAVVCTVVGACMVAIGRRGRRRTA